MTTPISAPYFLSRREVQRLAGTSKPTILHALQTGALPGVLIDGRWLISTEAAAQWIAGRRAARVGRPRRLPQAAVMVTE